jgi:hypothetical protein
MPTASAGTIMKRDGILHWCGANVGVWCETNMRVYRSTAEERTIMTLASMLRPFPSGSTAPSRNVRYPNRHLMIAVGRSASPQSYSFEIRSSGPARGTSSVSEFVANG